MIKAEEIKSLQQGHRERLRKKFLESHLEEYEILELLLTYAIPRRDVRLLARQLYNKYGNIHRMLSVPYEKLMENEGIKENTAVFFKVIHSLMLLSYESVLKDVPVFHDYEKLIHYCQLSVGGKATEEFHVLYLDGKYRLIKDELHSAGTTDWAAVYVREIIKKAVMLNARNIILYHNHPTPGTCFSEEDINMTQELENSLSKLGIGLYDHLVISGNEAYSAKNMHLLN